MDERTIDNDFKIIFWILVAIPIIGVLFSVYIRYQIAAFKRFKELLKYGILYPERNGPEVVADIVNKPPSVTWTVTCNRHKTGTGNYCYKEYKLTHPWPSNEGSWSVNTTRSCPYYIFEEPYLSLMATVTLSYANSDFPPELKQIEDEIYQQHLECHSTIFSIKRQTETIYHKFIVKGNNSTKWLWLRYWVSSIFLCSCSGFNTPLDKKVEYKIEKVFRSSAAAAATVTQNLSAMEVGQRQEVLPPSYQVYIANPDNYRRQHEILEDQPLCRSHSNHGNYGSIGVFDGLPSYEVYARNIDQPTLHSSNDIDVLNDRPPQAPSVITYEQEVTSPDAHGSSVSQEVSINATELILNEGMLDQTDSIPQRTQSEGRHHLLPMK